MSMFGKGFKGKITTDADGKPTGVGDVATATALDGALHGFTGVIDDKAFLTGLPATISKLVPVAAAIAGTSKVVSGSWLPRSINA